MQQAGSRRTRHRCESTATQQQSYTADATKCLPATQQLPLLPQPRLTGGHSASQGARSKADAHCRAYPSGPALLVGLNGQAHLAAACLPLIASLSSCSAASHACGRGQRGWCGEPLRRRGGGGSRLPLRSAPQGAGASSVPIGQRIAACAAPQPPSGLQGGQPGPRRRPTCTACP